MAARSSTCSVACTVGHDVARRNRYLELFDLDPTKKSRTYSRGNRQKVALIAALASDADLYLLDEPTAGLDPLKEVDFRTCVRELRDEGRTVLLSSHILSEAEALSDRVSIIRAGKVVETGRLDQLRHLTLTSVRAEVTTVPQALDRIDGVHDLVIDSSGETHTVSARVEQCGMDAVMQALSGAGIQSLTSQPPTLEELFLRHYGTPTTSRSGEPDPVPDSVPDSLAGTGTLLRLAVRRDRWLLPVWTLGFAAMAGFSASATADLYPDLAGRVDAARVVNATPSLVALYGRVYDPTSLGSLALIKLTAFGAALVAVLMIVVTVRHTRAEEEAGRLELLGAGVVGRDAPLAAALTLAFGASLSLGALTVAALAAAGLPATGALAFGLGWAGRRNRFQRRGRCHRAGDDREPGGDRPRGRRRRRGVPPAGGR